MPESTTEGGKVIEGNLTLFRKNEKKNEVKFPEQPVLLTVFGRIKSSSPSNIKGVPPKSISIVLLFKAVGALH